MSKSKREAIEFLHANRKELKRLARLWIDDKTREASLPADGWLARKVLEPLADSELDEWIDILMRGSAAGKNDGLA
jgi:hypothetical protein